MISVNPIVYPREYLCSMKAIVCIDLNWGIGNNGTELFRFKKDLQNFQELTEGHTVVMGYNTFLSLPGLKPLPNRRNIILTHKMGKFPDGFQAVNSIPELLNIVNPPDTFIIGGGAVYEQMLEYCNTLYLTRVDASVPADTFFPNLDREIDLSDISCKWIYVSDGVVFTDEDQYSGNSYSMSFGVYYRFKRGYVV